MISLQMPLDRRSPAVSCSPAHLHQTNRAGDSGAGEGCWLNRPLMLGAPIGGVYSFASSAARRSSIWVLARGRSAKGGIGRHDIRIDGFQLARQDVWLSRGARRRANLNLLPRGFTTW